MNSDRIQQLARMALEIEEIEAQAMNREPWNGDDLAADRVRPTIVARIGFGRMLAAAAVLAIAGVGTWGAWNAWKQVDSARSELAAITDDSTVPVAVTAPSHSVVNDLHSDKPAVPQRELVAATSPPVKPSIQSVVLTKPSPSALHRGNCNVVVLIVHDMSGKSRCVEFRQEDWDGRCASDLPEWELAMARGAMGPGCGKGSTRQVLVVALSGPADALPNTQHGAEDLAACILGLPRPCDAAGECYQNATANCLPQDVSFKVETLASR